MKLIIFISLFISLFNDCYLFSEYLQKVNISKAYDLIVKFDNNKGVKYKLVEVFSLFSTFDYSYNGTWYNSLNQFNKMIEKSSIAYKITLYPTIALQEIWVRVVNITILRPGNLVVSNDTWSININIKSASFNYVQSDFLYTLYVLPIYPAGNILSWSNDFNDLRFNRKGIIFDMLNKSIQLPYLEENGIVLYSSIEKSGSIDYRIASRMNRDFVLIVVVNASKNFIMQYPLIFVSGCLTSLQSCQLVKMSYLTYVVIVLALAFLCFSFYFDLIHVLFCGWISVVIVSFVIWKAVPYESYFEDTSIYVIIFGIAPVVALICVAICYFFTKKYNRIRMFFTAFIIGVIFVSVMWFIILVFKTWSNTTVFYIISAIVVFITILILSAFNYLTMTMGSIFISGVLISISLSITHLKSSIIPFIFIDFYNSFTLSTSNWIYYSPLLIDDLLIIGLCSLLSLIVGFLVYLIFKRCKSKKKINDEQVVSRIEILDSILLNRTTGQEPSTISHGNDGYLFSELPPTYTVNQTSFNIPLNNPTNLPPSYDACIKVKITPSAPIPTY